MSAIASFASSVPAGWPPASRSFLWRSVIPVNHPRPVLSASFGWFAVTPRVGDPHSPRKHERGAIAPDNEGLRRIQCGGRDHEKDVPLDLFGDFRAVLLDLVSGKDREGIRLRAELAIVDAHHHALHAVRLRLGLDHLRFQHERGIGRRHRELGERFVYADVEADLITVLGRHEE